MLKNAKAPRVVPVDENGIVRLDALEAMLKNIEGGALVSVMLANNETGVIQPVREIAEIVFRHGGYVHCDASQAVGKIPVDMMALGVDILTISAHKFGGPQGVGALIVKKGMGLSSLQKGGGQERGYRAGTENVAGIVGFGVALSRRHPPSFTKKNYRGIHLDGCNEEEGWPYSSAVRNSGHDVELRNKLEHAITSFAPGAVVFGEKANRLPNTSCIAMPGVSGETQVIDFDLKGFAVSSGAACSSGKVEVSHVLLAMGVEKELAASAIRVSLGYATAEAEIDAFIKAWQALYERTRGRRIAA